MPPALRPGLVVARRDDGHLQVGIDPPDRVVLPDRPDVRRALAALVQGEPPPCDPPTARVLGALGAAGLLVDRPSRARRPAGRPTAAVEAAWARHGDDADRRLSARACATVSVDAPPGSAEELVRLFTEAGLRASCGPVGDVHVALAHGPLPRDRVDACLRAGTPHLVVAGHRGGYVLGPFVLPGVTGCLRCDDARRGEADPRRAVVLEQAARLPSPAGDPVLLALATAWAVRDVLAWVEGDRPASWGTAYDLGDGPVPQGRRVERHPHCGCGWADFLLEPAG